MEHCRPAKWVFLLIFLASIFSPTAGLLTTELLPGAELFDDHGIPILDYGIETYGQYAVFNPPRDILMHDAQINHDCSRMVDNINLSSNTSGWYCAPTSDLFVAKDPSQWERGKTLHPRSHAMSYTMTVDSDDGGSLNITLDTRICPSTVMGDLISPQGVLMHKVTMAQIHDIICSLSLREQKAYLFRILQHALDEIKAELEQSICTSAGADRTLLWEGQAYHAVDMSGNWAYGVTGSVVLFGIAWVGTYSSGYGGLEAQLSNATQTSITAGAAVVFFGVTKLWDKFHRDGNFQTMEAIVASAFVAAGHGFVAGLRSAGSGSCIAVAQAASAIKDLYESCRNHGPQIIGDGNNPGLEMQAQNIAGQPQAVGSMDGHPVEIQAAAC